MNNSDDDFVDPVLDYSSSCRPKPRVQARPRQPAAIAEQSFDATDELSAGEYVSGQFFPQDTSTPHISPTMVRVPDAKKPDKSMRDVFLGTYSRANLEIVPTRKRFADIVVGEFNRDDVVVKKWACALEPHRDEAVHYHIAMKLDRNRRFKRVVELIKRKYGFHVHFDEFTTRYYDAYGYVVKVDRDYHIVSEGHVCLLNPPKTAAASNARRRLSAERRKEAAVAVTTDAAAAGDKAPAVAKKPFKPTLLRKEDVARIVIASDIHDDDELCALAQAQAAEGKTDLETFIFRNPKEAERQHVIEAAWKVARAKERGLRAKKTRMEILQEALALPCASNDNSGASCDGRWLPAALEVLQRNGIARDDFASVVTNSLTHGRSKGRNLMIIGGTNCAKTFILLPLVDIYDTFCSPAEGTFNWVGAPKKELVLLNDIRYEKDGDKKVMAWAQFLNLLDGSPLSIGMPKSHFACNTEWRAQQPIFATSDGPIQRITKDGRVDAGETAQMNERWVRMDFTHRFMSPDYSLVRCARCFASLILEEVDEDEEE